jgi:hypothetical protein
MTQNDLLPCPACGFLTLKDAYGSYALCDVCGWEDDQVQLANPACGGGANSESLIEAQAAALARYPLNLQVTNGVPRDSRWRPLDAAEISSAQRERGDEYWKKTGILELRDCYWMKSTSVREAG